MNDYAEQREREANVFTWEQPLGTTCARNIGTTKPKVNKYQKELRCGKVLDVYDVLDAYKVENPAIAHAIKKMLCAGQRGYKDYKTDIQEAIEALERAKDFPPIPF